MRAHAESRVHFSYETILKNRRAANPILYLVFHFKLSALEVSTKCVIYV